MFTLKKSIQLVSILAALSLLSANIGCGDHDDDKDHGPGSVHTSPSKAEP